jgi:hypothetical protein
MELEILQASAEGDFEADFADLAKLHIDGLVVDTDPVFDNWRGQLIPPAALYASENNGNMHDSGGGA